MHSRPRRSRATYSVFLCTRLSVFMRCDHAVPRHWLCGTLRLHRQSAYGSSATRRHPSENANIGRNFRIKERMNLQVRGEFVNILNRDLELGSPSTTSPQNPVTKNSLGILTGGFGVMPHTSTRHRRSNRPHGNGDHAVLVLSDCVPHSAATVQWRCGRTSVVLPGSG
jgi:hypothetical protein